MKRAAVSHSQRKLAEQIQVVTGAPTAVRWRGRETVERSRAAPPSVVIVEAVASRARRPHRPRVDNRLTAD